jgi:hypothetical protein
MKPWLACAVVMFGCGGPAAESSHGQAVRPPAEDIIFGTYERRPPQGTTAMKLARDGSLVVAHDRGSLDGDKPIATGSWQLAKDTLTLSYSMGACADAHTGTYKVNLSKLGIHFTKLADDCAQRAKIDGETWWRVRATVNE